MPCDLAVSIARAAVSEEHLRQLLTKNIVETVVLAYLQNKYPSQNPMVWSREGAAVIFSMDYGAVVLTVEDGDVQVDAYDQVFAEQLLTEIGTLLAQAADRLFQQQVGQALATVFGQVSRQAVEVDNAGVTQQAVVFTLDL